MMVKMQIAAKTDKQWVSSRSASKQDGQDIKPGTPQENPNNEQLCEGRT